MKKNIVLILLLFAFTVTNSIVYAIGPNQTAKTPKTVTTVYTSAKDIAPKSFTVETGQKVRFEVDPMDTGSGCMSAIMIPGLWDKPEPLVKGKKIVMEFTPKHPGSYRITCAMGIQRGVINVK
ncbi:MAG: cupredoxin domain-containing protein [Chlorobiaceae bacterium]